MGKIQFRSDKTKTKVFEDRNDTKKTALPINEKVDSWAKIQKEKPVKSGDEKPQYRNAAEVYEYLYNKLTLKYNIDTISVYQLYDNKNTDGRLHYQKVYGTYISHYEIEKFVLLDAQDTRRHKGQYRYNTQGRTHTYDDHRLWR